MHYNMGYSRDEIENMLPFEKDILIGQYNIQKDKETKDAEKYENKLSSGLPNVKKPNFRFKI